MPGRLPDSHALTATGKCREGAPWWVQSKLLHFMSRTNNVVDVSAFKHLQTLCTFFEIFIVVGMFNIRSTVTDFKVYNTVAWKTI